jgi:dTMP kinase
MDGLGGAGKTTTIRHLHRYLIERGYAVHTTTEPSAAPLGEIARHNTDTYRGYALACLVAADRYHHLATDIRPAIAAGRIVLCDRYVASSYVLQRMDGVPLAFIAALNSPTDLPDLAVILTADPEIAAARIGRRGAHSRFETGAESSQAEVELYRDAAERLTALGYPLLTINTSTVSAEQVAAEVGGRIAALMALRGRAPHAE